MELNNQIDPETGLPAVPSDMFWRVRPSKGFALPEVILVQNQRVLRSVRVRSPWYMRMFGISTVHKAEWHVLENYIGNKYIGESTETKPKMGVGSWKVMYRHGTTAYLKYDFNKQTIKEAAESAWDSYIRTAHESAFEIVLCGDFPPKSLK